MKSGKTAERASYTKGEVRLFIFIWVISLSIFLFPFTSDAATSPNIHVSPMSLNLGLVKAGGTSSPRPVNIKNTGKANLHISAVTSTDAEFSPSDNCTNTDIAPGNVCTFDITFSPTGLFGKKSATLAISSNAPKPIVNVKLSGNAPPPKISATPMAVNFGTVNMGNTSSSKEVTIRNTGLSDLTISNISISGTNLQDFHQDASDCSVLAKGSSCFVSISFTPSAPASKERASLDIYSDDPKKAELSVKLSGKGSGTSGGIPPVATDDNVMVVTVNGSLCSPNTSAFYPNKPCVSVKVCTPGTSTCQTIDDILLDTGSSGLRIFQQVLTVPLTPVNSGAGSLAECIEYADGSSDWGSVQMASVVLGNEAAVQVPIQVIDSTFGTLSVPCGTSPDKSPTDAGFNGILGVGLFAQDCGQACSGNNSNNGMYYECDGSGCQGTAVQPSSQVQNPVALLLTDNNGVIVELPAVPLGGMSSVDDGLLVLGIGTRANNIPPAAVKSYPADQYGEFTTTFDGNTYTNGSFIDTGSNGLFFPSTPSLPDCASPNLDWFCPLSTQSFSATNQGSSGSPSGAVSFDIGNYDSLTNTSDNVFVELGGNNFGGFDWGLPFHFGKNVYVGLEGTVSSLGSGTYWAY